MSAKQLEKRNQNKTPAFLAALNCDILKIAAWIMYFHGLWQMSPSWMKSNSHSLKKPKTIFHVYFTFERERIDPVVMHSDITVWPLTFLYSPAVPFLVSKRLQRWTTTVSHLGCAATAQTGVLELRLSDQKLSGRSLDPGRRQKLPQAGPLGYNSWHSESRHSISRVLFQA